MLSFFSTTLVLSRVINRLLLLRSTLRAGYPCHTPFTDSQSSCPRDCVPPAVTLIPTLLHSDDHRDRIKTPGVRVLHRRLKKTCTAV